MASRAIVALAVAAAVAPVTATVAAAAPLRLFHDSFSTAYRSPAGAVPAGSRVTLRLRATGQRVRAVTLRVEGGDPSGGGSVLQNVPMRRRGALWSVSYRTPARPVILKYSFRVRLARGTRWYGDDDSGTDIRKGGTGRTTPFRGDGFQLSVYAPGFTTPSWLRGAVVYEIFADRFRDGDRSNDYCRAGSTTGCPSFYGTLQATLHGTWNEPLEDAPATGFFNRDFFGGDLQGVQQKLDYLKDLGVEAIWLTPIFDARSNHRYDTADYMHIDPSLGGDAAFASLAAAAHARGIHLILDGVFNHTSSDSRYFDRYSRYPETGACESPTSPFRGWYSITGTDVPCRTYSAFANLDTLPQLNHANAAVRDFVYRGADSVVRHWVTRGADGWRLDAAQEVPHDWWRDFRTVVKGYAADAPLIGEITAGPEDATPYLVGNELDGVMNYRFRSAVDGYVRLTNYSDSSGEIRALRPSQLDHALDAILEDYPRAATESSFSLIDSHDTNRALFVLAEPGDTRAVATERQRLAALLQFAWVGAPMVYYGDEVALDAPGKSGRGDPYNRAPYPWTDETGSVATYGPPDTETLTYYAVLARIRRELPALRRGRFTTLLTGDTSGASGDNDVYAFARSGGGDQPVVVVVNKGSAAETARVPLRGLFPGVSNLVDKVKGGGAAPVAAGAVTLTLPPRTGRILVRP
jgi:cyclomaltodextrinase